MLARCRNGLLLLLNTKSQLRQKSEPGSSLAMIPTHVHSSRAESKDSEMIMNYLAAGYGVSKDLYDNFLSVVTP